METCDWCGRELKGWFYRYKEHTFCEYNDGRCIKNYLFYEHDEEITEDRGDGEVDYDMSEVDEYEDS